MSHQDTERQSYRVTEKLSHGDTEDTEETEDVPSLAASVKTLQEAVQLSLKDGLNKDCLFKFARAIKAFEITHDHRLPPAELQSAFSLWWSTAKPLLPPDADMDEWLFVFEDTYQKTHAALGANSLQEAIRLADANPPPPQAARFPSPNLKRLIAVCYYLQMLQGNSPFFLGVRDAAKIADAKSLMQAAAWLAGLVHRSVLIEVEKGTRKRATRFRFNLPQPPPSPSQITPNNPPRQPSPPVAATTAKPAEPRTARTPTTYELVERKRALQDLINALPRQDRMNADNQKRCNILTKELADVNAQLAGVPPPAIPEKPDGLTLKAMREAVED